ncbi:MAG: GNAT family N-acetyltransferase [Dialister sp.]|nr:GNAT family N-acetyltransferase [Dialister sp.]
MQLVMKYFNELSLDELYDILSARSAVFVVEQHCAYQDPDDIDRKALHLFFREQNQIKAYLRLFKKDDHTVQIGRLLSLERNQGLARKLLSAGIKASCQFNGDRLYLETQLQARALYETEGFTQEGDPFERDGIPHIAMVRCYHC